MLLWGLNKSSSLSLNGFSGFFYHNYWDIIKVEVCNVVTQFFSSGWMLLNCNACTVVLFQKSKDAQSLDMFRPITLSNFKCKIIAKILADRLATIMPFLVSIKKRGFIHGRNIQDCTCLASEAINVLDNKNKYENLALKVYIAMAFDTIS